jgi:hypothetical protein
MPGMSKRLRVTVLAAVATAAWACSALILLPRHLAVDHGHPGGHTHDHRAEEGHRHDGEGPDDPNRSHDAFEHVQDMRARSVPAPLPAPVPAAYGAPRDAAPPTSLVAFVQDERAWRPPPPRPRPATAPRAPPTAS